jgi:DNA-binding NarL/FixJ family response regulator
MPIQNTILIVEDEFITATSILELLTEENYTIIGVANNASKALLLCNKTLMPPTVVICDINIQGPVKGIELATQLSKLYNCEIIFLTAYHDTKTLNSAFDLGPTMYIVKPYTDTQLLVAVQLAFHKVFEKQQVKSSAKIILTLREKEIVQLIAKGLTSKEIGRKLHISTETVKTHRKKILEKNEMHNFSELIFMMQQAL